MDRMDRIENLYSFKRENQERFLFGVEGCVWNRLKMIVESYLILFPFWILRNMRAGIVVYSDSEEWGNTDETPAWILVIIWMWENAQASSCDFCKTSIKDKKQGRWFQTSAKPAKNVEIIKKPNMIHWNLNDKLLFIMILWWQERTV